MFHTNLSPTSLNPTAYILLFWTTIVPELIRPGIRRSDELSLISYPFPLNSIIMHDGYKSPPKTKIFPQNCAAAKWYAFAMFSSIGKTFQFPLLSIYRLSIEFKSLPPEYPQKQNAFLDVRRTLPGDKRA